MVRQRVKSLRGADTFHYYLRFTFLNSNQINLFKNQTLVNWFEHCYDQIKSRKEAFRFV